MALTGQPDGVFQSRSEQRRTYARHSSIASEHHVFNKFGDKYHEDTSTTYMGSVKTYAEVGKAEICVM